MKDIENLDNGTPNNTEEITAQNKKEFKAVNSKSKSKSSTSSVQINHAKDVEVLNNGTSSNVRKKLKDSSTDKNTSVETDNKSVSPILSQDGVKRTKRKNNSTKTISSRNNTRKKTVLNKDVVKVEDNNSFEQAKYKEMSEFKPSSNTQDLGDVLDQMLGVSSPKVKVGTLPQNAVEVFSNSDANIKDVTKNASVKTSNTEKKKAVKLKKIPIDSAALNELEDRKSVV